MTVASAGALLYAEREKSDVVAAPVGSWSLFSRLPAICGGRGGMSRRGRPNQNLRAGSLTLYRLYFFFLSCRLRCFFCRACVPNSVLGGECEEAARTEGEMRATLLAASVVWKEGRTGVGAAKLRGSECRGKSAGCCVVRLCLRSRTQHATGRRLGMEAGGRGRR